MGETLLAPVTYKLNALSFFVKFSLKQLIPFPTAFLKRVSGKGFYRTALNECFYFY